MPYEIAESFRCSFSGDSIYYWPESDIRVKSYGRLNLPCASMFNFEHLDIYVAQSDIRVKSYDPLNFLSASVVHIRATRYIIGLNQKSEPNVVAV